MGVAKTLPNYKSFTFGGTNSKNYGVYITGQGVFNAPERNVEMIEIPGRNGAYALDKGNFNNIEVTYPAGIFADNATDFASAVSDLRNFLCSQKGYVRLEDDYNPNEYRLAVYKSGLEVSHDMLIAGEFDITFECKPQRFLTSGETAVSVASGGTLTNPTLFSSKPMLELYGGGSIDIGGAEITLNATPIGTIVVANNRSYSTNTVTAHIDTQYANIGDAIRSSVFRFRDIWYISGLDISSLTVSATGNGNATFGKMAGNNNEINVKFNDISFAYGTSKTETTTATYSMTINGNAETCVVVFSVAYDGDDTFSITASETLSADVIQYPNQESLFAGQILLDSTDTSLGTPVYIDLDIGEAYKIENGSAVSVNNAVSMPAELPTLPSGTTTITYDNTFTQVKIMPRWWKV